MRLFILIMLGMPFLASLEFKTVSLDHGFGEIRYGYEGDVLRCVERWKEGELLYTHRFQNDYEDMICDLGELKRDLRSDGYSFTSPYSTEEGLLYT